MTERCGILKTILLALPQMDTWYVMVPDKMPERCGNGSGLVLKFLKHVVVGSYDMSTGLEANPGIAAAIRHIKPGNVLLRTKCRFWNHSENLLRS